MHTSVSMYSTNKAGSQNSVGFFSIFFFFLICHARHVLQHIHLWISMQMTDTLWKTSPRETCLLKLDVVSWLNALETERSQHWFVFTYGIFTWINPGGLFKKNKNKTWTHNCCIPFKGDWMCCIKAKALQRPLLKRQCIIEWRQQSLKKKLALLFAKVASFHRGREAVCPPEGQD